MTEQEQKKSAKAFAVYWKDKGDEKSDTQSFWIMLLREVFGVEEPEKMLEFEKRVKDKTTNFIDCYIASTKVMIEQKTLGKDLRKGIRQSDGSVLSPFQQAKRYIANLPVSKHPRWLITCNFAEFLVYDMEKPNCEPEQIFLKDLPKEYYRLQFLVNKTDGNLQREMEISLKAGELVGLLYDAILKQYQNPENPETLKSLNILCVRLVFCLYAEHAGIFGTHDMFGNYLKRFEIRDVRKALIELFQVLDTPIPKRDPYMNDELSAFPYVNGGLFADENIEIPRFTEEIVNLLIHSASEGFDWSEISPTIFGAVFESTLNPNIRRSSGMHYTSIENIHKVIDPLFLDDLKSELAEIKTMKVKKIRDNKLKEYRNKLANLNFLDPACGSGNFLTETYLSLRKLENDALFTETGGQLMLGSDDLIKVSIGQFYGIEINDFAVSVARTALWIAEHQMLRETEQIMQVNLDFLPLKSYANIIEGNALRINWEDVVPKHELNFIMGNPPFVGKKEQTKEQKQDVINIFGKKVKGVGNLDYVTCWYRKAIDTMKNTKINTAFVSTNSIAQGEQVPIFWKELLSLGICINFAYQTFKWNSESNSKANVHCVIIGFNIDKIIEKKKLFSADKFQIVDNINPYLINAPTVIIENRNKSISENAPQIYYGSMSIDNGNLILNKEDVQKLLQESPQNKRFIRKYVGGAELIKNKERWCLWLVDASPKEINSSTFIKERVKNTADFRKSSNRPQTLALVNTPMLFGEIRQPKTDMIAIPKVSSENRKYIPISYVSSDIIVNGSALIIPNANLFHFGVLISNVHMAWIKTVCGRIKSDYQYSGNIVYNNFPWCNPIPEQKKLIEKTAQEILNARSKYPDCSLADLYDELTMPPELRKAHQQNDFAVMQAYGFDKKITESECVAELMKMYQKLTK